MGEGRSPRDAAKWFHRGRQATQGGHLDQVIDSRRRASGRNRNDKRYLLAPAQALALKLVDEGSNRPHGALLAHEAHGSSGGCGNKVRSCMFDLKLSDVYAPAINSQHTLALSTGLHLGVDEVAQPGYSDRATLSLGALPQKVIARFRVLTLTAFGALIAFGCFLRFWKLTDVGLCTTSYGPSSVRLIGRSWRCIGSGSLETPILPASFCSISPGSRYERGDWLEARIDTAIATNTAPKPDLRKMLVPMVSVVFGAANFPYADSTAGGDTATAFAAGCPVIVKAHPAHAGTSELVAQAILSAATKCNMPDGIFTHIHGASFEVGKALVEHPYTKAVGFTGSLTGGRQLFDWANQRKEPIPVFAEMSSINPVFLLPEKLKESAADVAKLFAGSVTLGVGQFCTNPGLLIGIDSPDLQQFIQVLSNEISRVPAADMLNTGIFKNYVEKRANALAQEGVDKPSQRNHWKVSILFLTILWPRVAL